MPIQTMNKKKDWQAGLGIKSHKPFCKRPSGGLSCPSSGHLGTKRWASIEQAMGIDCPCGVHRVPKSQATLGHSLQICGFAFMHNASWRFCDT